VKTERRMKIMTVTEDYISRVYPKDNRMGPLRVGFDERKLGGFHGESGPNAKVYLYERISFTFRIAFVERAM